MKRHLIGDCKSSYFAAKYFIIFFILLCNAHTLQASWAEDTLKQMTLREKIGQLFVVAAASCLEQPEEQLATLIVSSPYNVRPDYIQKMVTDYHVGGLLLLYKSTPAQQVEFINQYQKIASIPLCIFQDCEWGLNMRLYDTVYFPKNMTLGAIQNNTLLYELGFEIGKQCAAVGVHMNLAPVIDINYNPFNPVIFDRSFGQDKNIVAEKALYIMRGMQDAGILTCAKHFPGHGDTTVDSHVDLPTIYHDATRLHSIELYPFRKIINEGCNAVMTAHICIPSFEQIPHVPASLSRALVTDVLQHTLGFKGLIITDGMGMEAIIKYRDSAHAALEAFMAGNDIILACPDIPAAVQLFEEAVNDKRIDIKDLNGRVLKILKVKESIHLNKQPVLSTYNLHEQLHNPYSIELKKRLFQEAITIVKGHEYIPLNMNNIGLLQIGGNQQNMCMEILRRQHHCTALHVPSHMTHEQMQSARDQLKDKDLIIVSISDINKYAQRQFGISDVTIELLDNCTSAGKKIVIVIFGNPYCLRYFLNCNAIIMAYEDVPEAQEAAALVLLGTHKATGKLPITIVENKKQWKS